MASRSSHITNARSAAKEEEKKYLERHQNDAASRGKKRTIQKKAKEAGTKANKKVLEESVRKEKKEKREYDQRIRAEEIRRSAGSSSFNRGASSSRK